MEDKIAEDIGEEIISKLKELNLILEKRFKEENNGKKFSPAHYSGNRILRIPEKTGK